MNLIIQPCSKFPFSFCQVQNTRETLKVALIFFLSFNFSKMYKYNLKLLITFQQSLHSMQVCNYFTNVCIPQGKKNLLINSVANYAHFL